MSSRPGYPVGLVPDKDEAHQSYVAVASWSEQQSSGAGGAPLVLLTTIRPPAGRSADHDEWSIVVVGNNGNGSIVVDLSQGRSWAGAGASWDPRYLSSRDSRRSASGLPPVWQVGQYCSDESANETSRMVSPHTGQGCPVRACTRRPLFFSPFRSAAARPGRAFHGVAQRGLDRVVQDRHVVRGQAGRQLERGHLRGVQHLVGVGVADAGDDGLVAQHALDLGAAPGQQAGQRVGGEVGGQRVGAEAGDARAPRPGRGPRRRPAASACPAR